MPGSQQTRTVFEPSEILPFPSTILQCDHPLRKQHFSVSRNDRILLSRRSGRCVSEQKSLKGVRNRLLESWSSLWAGGDFKAECFRRCGRPCFNFGWRASIDAGADGRQFSLCLKRTHMLPPAILRGGHADSSSFSAAVPLNQRSMRLQRPSSARVTNYSRSPLCSTFRETVRKLSSS